ncbi:hypothetical protein CC80DRAFT_440765 [Byssothecium circinans]|uniref:F-box domain-containing protein n=1 Tax=Byssothecium circinans TaxID=147558 RepID=A0A6A5U5U3_9PLEO|nr:hypothetical protein CC80DRAFT_440765 [Byssothecium circinans]
MGQNFLITAPQILEILTGGKLGEILFDGTAKSLVEFLVVPVRPEETTIAEIDVANTDENQAGCTETQHTKGRTEDADDKSVRHPKRRKIQSRNVGQVKLTAKSPFSELPTELHDLVFDNLEIDDVLSLSLTSRYFWTVGRRHMQTYYLSLLGPWAGKKIVCVREDVEARDYPPGLFTKDQEEILRQSKDEDGHPMSLLHYSMEEYAEWVKFPSPYSIFGQLLDTEEYHRMARSDRSQLSDIVWQDTSRFYPSDQPWILRNLSTKEFVRSEAIAPKPEYIHGPNIDFLGFGEVVLSRTCWSTSSSINMRYDGDIHRGIWAGHSFDITTLGRHRQDSKADDWKDVSGEVATEIASIWESEYGSEWREEICKPPRCR